MWSEEDETVWRILLVAELVLAMFLAWFLADPVILFLMPLIWICHHALLNWARWQGKPHYATGPEAALIGRAAIFVASDDGFTWARLDGTVWPARLPPFEPMPVPGTTGVVVNVADGMLVLRPLHPDPQPEP